MMRISLLNLLVAVLIITDPTIVHGDISSHQELAKKLTNPVASLISVPLQFNYDENIGDNDDGERFVVNIQPVIPVSLNADWNVISRTILPLISQNDIAPGAGSQSGAGDVLQSVFFSPKEPSTGGWIWGAGPVFLLPTGSEDELTADKWGVGPTAVALKQAGPWTYGMLVNHVVDVAGDSDRDDISSTFFQPFLTYTTKSATTFALNIEGTHDWESDDSSIPLNFQINRITKLGNQIIQVGGGLRYWLENSEQGPEGFGLRINLVFLYPQ